MFKYQGISSVSHLFALNVVFFSIDGYFFKQGIRTPYSGLLFLTTFVKLWMSRSLPSFVPTYNISTASFYSHTLKCD